ncbi:uncharacterized protein K02A2.6-like [Copidosoma floridanum]|uniref:uncharacterized protein K02A2.6-like n=1 Tax=Copidosoma floridanum TaxID=29053 RepID=UPI0006C9AD66|nr:uncharacterized protein K02A2.6-like [Copidosoma floridanum]
MPDTKCRQCGLDIEDVNQKLEDLRALSEQSLKDSVTLDKYKEELSKTKSLLEKEMASKSYVGSIEAFGEDDEWTLWQERLEQSVPYALRKLVEEELDRLVKEKVVFPVERSEWATPIVSLLKEDGKVRICGDYKVTLNSHLKIDRYPIPRVRDLLATLDSHNVQSKLDLKNAYQQIELDDSSKAMTTISTHKGLFRFNRLAFGVASAPGWFQKEMEELLGDVEGVNVFFDDIRVGGRNRKEHDMRLIIVLRRLQKVGLTLKLEKCKFNQSKVKFLGHDIDKNGIHVVKEKVQAISHMPRPQNIKEFQIFLEKNREWKWSSQCEVAFMRAKESLTSHEVLTHYNPEYPIKVTCDASSTGIGAVLSHILPDKSVRPVAYVSRTLSKAERNYAQLDREALALVAVLSNVRKYVKWGWPNQVSSELTKFKNKELELSIENDCLLWGHRLIIPEILRPVILWELHSGHMGVVKMKALARSYVWWPGLDGDVERIAKSCEACLKYNDSPPRSSLHVCDWPDVPGMRIHADFLGPVEGRMYLVIIDAHSKWVDIKPMRDISSKSTIEAFKEYFAD